MTKIYFVYIFLALFFLSCNTLHVVSIGYDNPTDNVESDSQDTIPVPLDIINEWKLDAVRANADERFLKIDGKDKTPTLYINGDSRAGGYDGCNGFSSKVVFVDDDKFYFTHFLSTSRGCPPSVYWDNLFYQSLSDINNYTIQDGKLFLKKDLYVLMIFSKR